MTQAELSALTLVPTGSIVDIEVGRIVTPSHDAIERISQATNYPVSFFVRGPLPDLPEGNFRRLRRGTSKVAKQVRAEVRHIAEIVQEAEAFAGWPPVRIRPVANIEELDEIENIAARVRAELGLDARSPIRNMVRTAERAGIVVVTLASAMDDHDGFSAWPDYGLGGRPVIAIARGNPGDRDRNTVGHELGHLVLHTVRRGIEQDRAEKEAYRFANAFLLPEEVAREAIRPPVTLMVLKAVKIAYGTSIAANAKRALDLQIIDQYHFVSLRKQMSARGWNKREPVEVASEKPLLFAQALNIVAAEGTVRERAERCGYPIFEFNAHVG